VRERLRQDVAEDPDRGSRRRELALVHRPDTPLPACRSTQWTRSR
jgi:hypothetical protein